MATLVLIRPVSVGVAAILGLLMAACSTTSAPAATPTLSLPAPRSSPTTPAAATQVSEGQVTVAVTWQDPPSGLVFVVVMDTHSGSLDGYDLRQLAVLRTDQGRQVRPSGWDAPPGGHHRQGTLTFPATAPDGRPLIESTTGAIELIIRNVGDKPERVLRWGL